MQKKQSPGFFSNKRAGKHTKHQKSRSVLANTPQFPCLGALRHKAQGVEVLVGARRHGLTWHRCVCNHHSTHTPQTPRSVHTPVYVYIDTYTYTHVPLYIYTRIYVYTHYIYRNTHVISAHAPKYLITQRDRTPPPTGARGGREPPHRRQRQPGVTGGGVERRVTLARPLGGCHFPLLPSEETRARTPAPPPPPYAKG